MKFFHDVPTHGHEHWRKGMKQFCKTNGLMYTTNHALGKMRKAPGDSMIVGSPGDTRALGVMRAGTGAPLDKLLLSAGGSH